MGRMTLFDTPPDDACYLALKARDARFDGRFFTGVTSTGIYCRPVCRVRAPRRENCRFFGNPAQAEQAGFRPCLRCRPELAPQTLPWSTQDAAATLALQAARLLDERDPAALAASAEPASVAALARRLGVSDRHLRRIFEAQFGVAPLRYLQTQRLLRAKQLLTDTDLPVTAVAQASGYASLRRFNAAFVEHYRLNPTQWRRQRPVSDGGQRTTLRLGYRPPYDVAALLGFFAQRQIAGVERVDPARGTLARTLMVTHNGRSHAGWLCARFDPARCAVELRVGDGLRAVLPQVIQRLRAALDLDADPQAIAAALDADFPGHAGLRVPGTLDGFELAVRAILGQQVTVAAGRTLTQRLVERCGTALATPEPGLDRLFPTPEALAATDGEALGQLGIVRQRQAAIRALALAVAQGGLRLHPLADPAATMAQLRALPGIGDWTAQYIAMRALRWPDAFPAGDVALHHALGLRGQRRPEVASLAAAERWRPWRSYAVLRAWAGPVPRAVATEPPESLSIQ